MRTGKAALALLALLACFSSNCVFSAPSEQPNTTQDENYDPTKCGCGLGSHNKRGRIVGGEEAVPGTAPWLVALKRDNNPHCGAALISNKHLLTAAHCVQNIPIADLTAWVGFHSLSIASEGMRIVRAWPHPEFDLFTFKNDIAILELEEPVKINSLQKPICLPNNQSEEYSSRTAIIAGWGRTGEQEPPSDVLRQAFVQVWGKSRCKKAGYPERRVSGEILCAGLVTGGVDACQGDSGGPLILQGAYGDMQVIGIVSWGRGCARPNLPGVYTRVASYLPFIQTILMSRCS